MDAVRRRCLEAAESVSQETPEGRVSSSQREFMIGGIFLSPLNTPISPCHSPRARAAAELGVDSRSIYTCLGLSV